MLLTLTGAIGLGVQNLQAMPKGKMRSGSLVVGDNSIPCVIRHVVCGKVEKLDVSKPEQMSLIVHQRLLHTAFTKKGFVDVLITADSVQFNVYIHVDNLGRFFEACAMSIIRANFKL